MLPGLFKIWLFCLMTCFYGLFLPSDTGCTKLPCSQPVHLNRRLTPYEGFFCLKQKTQQNIVMNTACYAGEMGRRMEKRQKKKTGTINDIRVFRK